MEIIKSPVNAGFSVEVINSAIESLARNQATASRSIGRVMVMAIWAANATEFVDADGNVTERKPSADVANALMKNLRKGVRKTAIVEVLQALGNLAYVSGNFAYFDAKRGYGADEAKHIKMVCAEWESFKPAPPAAKVVDVVEALDTLVQSLIRKAQKEGELTSAKYLERIVQLNAAIKGEVFDVQGVDTE